MVQTGLQGKVVLITGGNHGIGAATAQAFATEGAAILINYLRLPALGSSQEESAENVEEDKTAPGLALYNFKRSMSAERVGEAIRARGGRVEAIEADLADVATIQLLFERAEAVFGPVDVLVNNADHCVADTFVSRNHLDATALTAGGYAVSTITAASHDTHFAVNSRAVALVMAEYARRRIERGLHGGRIINVSTDGAAGFFHEASYGASKYAMESYSRAATAELGAYGITVNIVSPGPIQTGYITAELEKRVVAEIPLGRVGQPEDVADVIVFLASEQARWLTGQLLFVGGGHRMV